MATEASKLKAQQEKIIADFQTMRNEQRNLATKLNTLEMELKEHKTVIETLKTVDESRKCFRLIGGVLCERTVKEVLPQLVGNKEHLEQACEKLTKDLQKKGTDINRYREEHKIRFQGEQLPESKSASDENSQNRNVLVSN